MNALLERSLFFMEIKFLPKTNIEKFVYKIFLLLVDNSTQTYFVGGMVRNLILQIPYTDFDLATNLSPEEINSILEKNKISTDRQFKNLGIILVPYKKEIISISSFRKDVYTNGRYPEITLVKTTQQDAIRRDFTINALYFDPITNTILDYHEGIQDIRNACIRFIGNPKNKILEDPLRIIRALRFALVLNFKIERKSFLEIKNNFLEIKKISMNRIEKEILKIKNKNQEKIIREVINNQKTLDIYFHSY